MDIITATFPSLRDPLNTCLDTVLEPAQPEVQNALAQERWGLGATVRLS